MMEGEKAPTPQRNLEFLVESIKTKKHIIQGAIKELRLAGISDLRPKDVLECLLPLERKHDEDLRPFVEEGIAEYIEDRSKEEEYRRSKIREENLLREAREHERQLLGDEEEIEGGEIEGEV